MRNKASNFLKQIISVLSSMAKSKTLALKTKTSAIKTRLIIFSLLRNKKILMDSISHKLHALVGHQDKANGSDNEGEQCNAIVHYNALAHDSLPNPTLTELAEKDDHHDYKEEEEEEEEKDDKYPDLTHSLFESDQDPGGSVIDLVKKSKQEEGEVFSLEDEIDHVADLFIKRFHRQMMMQKQQSFKRYQEMLERSA